MQGRTVTHMFDDSAAQMGPSPPDSPTSPASRRTARSEPETPKTPVSRLNRHMRNNLRQQESQEPRPQHTSETEEQSSSVVFWEIIIFTAVLSSILSFVIDQFTYIMGLARNTFVVPGDPVSLCAVILFNVCAVLLARRIVRTTVEAEGSGFPEIKAMLFGKVMTNYLTLRVLVVKALGLSLVVGAGLPIGKEGPNVHMATCIARSLNPGFFQRSMGTADGTARVNKIVMACCAVGVGSTFSAPIGGVIFAMELMLPQVYDANAYWGCFMAAVVGSLCFAVPRSWASNGQDLLPLMSTNVQPGEGTTEYPFLRCLLDICLGVLCGLLGGFWVRMHSFVAGVLKRWRLRGAPPAPPIPSHQLPLLCAEEQEEDDEQLSCLDHVGNCLAGEYQWRDLFLVSVVAILNTYWASRIPIVSGKTQPQLLSSLFDKTLLDDADTWPYGVAGTLLCAFLMKWVTTILALSLPTPTGVVAPTMIIGALLGRCFVMLVPVEMLDFLLGENAADPTARSALMARFAIVGASAFCAAVCRTFAMAITVFEVLALPNAVVPMCSATLAAIFVANRVSLPFFDANLSARGLGGISALTSSNHALKPASLKMRRFKSMAECLLQKTTPSELKEALQTSNNSHFPIVRVMAQDSNDLVILIGSMSRASVELLAKAVDPNGSAAEHEIDLLEPALLRWRDGRPPLVEPNPLHVSPTASLKDVYLMMKVSHGEPVVYVTQDGGLLGIITFSSLLSERN